MSFKCKLAQMVFIGGVVLVPRMYKLSGICPRERSSALAFFADEIQRVEIFKIFLYLMRSIAATTAQTKGSGARRLDSQATTFVLSVQSVTIRFETCGMKVYNATQAARSSSHAISTHGNGPQPSHVLSQGASCSIDNEKYLSPQYPPMPPDSDASTKRGGCMAGNVPRMKEKCSPLLRAKSKCQTRKHMDIMCVNGRIN